MFLLSYVHLAGYQSTRCIWLEGGVLYGISWYGVSEIFALRSGMEWFCRGRRVYDAMIHLICVRDMIE